MRAPVRIAVKVLAVPVVAAIVAAIAIPNLLEPKISWNDVYVLASLRTLGRVQEEFRERRFVDLDGDGAGEFGSFGELTGVDGVRADAAARRRGSCVDPPILSPSLSSVDDEGRASRSGYFFRLLLPGNGGAPVHEGRAATWSGGVCPEHGPCPGPPTRHPCPSCKNPPPRVIHPGTGFSGPVDADGAERSWCAYAWPVQAYGELKGSARFHNRVFFADASGGVWQTFNQDCRYRGEDHAPSWDAAMPEDGWGVAWASPPAGVEEYRGRDGNLWKRVN